MEHPCLTCTTKKFCQGSRNTLRKRAPGQPPEYGPCEPFNRYVMFLQNKTYHPPEARDVVPATSPQE